MTCIHQPIDMNPVHLFLIIVTLPLLLGGCGEKGVNEEELERREGIMYLKGSDAPYTGKSFRLFNNGQKMREENYKDGKPDGLHVGWHENGQKGGEANFKDGKMISEKYWNSKGEPVDTIEEALE